MWHFLCYKSPSEFSVTSADGDKKESREPLPKVPRKVESCDCLLDTAAPPRCFVHSRQNSRPPPWPALARSLTRVHVKRRNYALRQTAFDNAFSPSRPLSLAFNARHSLAIYFRDRHHIAWTISASLPPSRVRPSVCPSVPPPAHSPAGQSCPSLRLLFHCHCPRMSERQRG